MSDERVRLRTSFQFARIDELRDRLGEKPAGNDKARRAAHTIAARALEALLLWLGQPVDSRKAAQFVEKWSERPVSDTSPAGRVLSALEETRKAAESRSGLELRLLRRIHALLNFSSTDALSAYRLEGQTAEFPGHEPFPPEHIAGAVERSLEWFNSPGAEQLHPLERSVLALARMSEIAPFPAPNLPALVVACSYELVASGFPPLVFFPDERLRLHRALQAAARMQTQPLIDLFVGLETQLLEDILERR